MGRGQRLQQPQNQVSETYRDVNCFTMLKQFQERIEWDPVCQVSTICAPNGPGEGEVGISSWVHLLNYIFSYFGVGSYTVQKIEIFPKFQHSEDWHNDPRSLMLCLANLHLSNYLCDESFVTVFQDVLTRFLLDDNSSVGHGLRCSLRCPPGLTGGTSISRLLDFP